MADFCLLCIVRCVQGPYRHYILNALWILINLLCVFLTLYQVGTALHSWLTVLQLRRLYRDFTSKNLAAVRVAGLFTSLLSLHTEVGRLTRDAELAGQ